MPKVSVIIPVYNVEKYLGFCLNTVLCQTMRKDMEIICVNDGSTDGSLAVLHKYTTRYPEIHVISQPNKGLSEARNTGIDNSTGEYLYFLDSDDLLHPQCMEIAYTMAKRHNAPLVAFDFYRDDGKGAIPLRGWQKIDVDNIRETITTNPLKYLRGGKERRLYNSTWSKFFRRDLFDKVRFEPGLYFEDMISTSILLREKPKTVIIPEKLHWYRTTEGSIMNSKFSHRHLDSYRKGFELICEAYEDEKYDKIRKLGMKNVLAPALEEIVWQLEHTPAKNKRALLPGWRSLLADLIAKGRISWAIKDSQHTDSGVLNPSSAPAPSLILPADLKNDLIRTSRKNYGRRRGRSRS
jgi:glycosyltransferase involved in cell wall biosynthesis